MTFLNSWCIIPSMKTIDQLLIHLVGDSEIPLETLLPPKDVKLLRSLASAVNNNWFITEDQSKLLVSVLTRHQLALAIKDASIEQILSTPSNWSAPFRQIENIRKLFLSVHNDIPVIVISFSYSPALRSLMFKCNFVRQITNGKLYHADITEKNIYALVAMLKECGFDIDTNLLNYYSIISAWDEDTIRNQFLVSNIVDKNILTELPDNLQSANVTDKLIIMDRGHRYQYIAEHSVDETTLSGMIATRKTSKIWIDSMKYSLVDILRSLIELQRLPILFTFDTFDPLLATQKLKEVSNALEEVGICDKIGIYVRLKNSCGHEFNHIISEKKYNCLLDNNTVVAGVHFSKLPKFFIRTDWQPMSVISLSNSFSNNLHSSKTSIYAARCDLIITHSEHAPLLMESCY